MSWTYDPSQMGSSPMMQVRYLVGDTLATDQQVQDEEINFAISQRPQFTVLRQLCADPWPPG
jgi:hypothetical protein